MLKQIANNNYILKPFRKIIINVYSIGMYNEIVKANIMRWRENNREHYNEYMLEINKKNYYNNQEHFKKKRMERYFFEKECKRLRNILFDF